MKEDSPAVFFRIKLDIKATRQANEENKTAIQVINEYEQMLKETKDHTPE